jgi:dienelactone hydrolase
MYVPPALREAKGATHTFLILPNNTGKVDDDFEVHEADVVRRSRQAAAVAGSLGVAVIMPVFPRPKADWRIYTHALDRDSMVTQKLEYRRLDLQMVAIIDHARELMKKDGLKFDKRVLVNGFSASGMFANRFAFLHPERVKAAVVGSPGGLPLMPVGEFKGKKLRYPIGTADWETVAGGKLNLKELRKVPMFVFLGDKDDNDSVVFGDSYDEEDKTLIFELFGEKPVERWETAKQLYKDAGLNAEFRLYPGIAHSVTKEIQEDVKAFLVKSK